MEDLTITGGDAGIAGGRRLRRHSRRRDGHRRRIGRNVVLGCHDRPYRRESRVRRQWRGRPAHRRRRDLRFPWHDDACEATATTASTHRGTAPTRSRRSTRSKMPMTEYASPASRRVRASRRRAGRWPATGTPASSWIRVTADVTLDSVSQDGGAAGIVLDGISGRFTVTGGTTISQTTGSADPDIRLAGGHPLRRHLDNGARAGRDDVHRRQRRRGRR